MDNNEIITVIAPGACKRWLTPGKEYEAKVFKFSKNLANITCDTGDTLLIRLKECCHLQGQDWIIK